MDDFLFEVSKKAIKYVQEKVEYCDIRAETQRRNSILIENGEIEHTRENSDKGIGIRVLNNGAWGFTSISNPQNFEEIKIGLDKAIKNTNYFAEKKYEKSKLIPIKTSKVNKKFSSIEKTYSR